jgi:hypothetical protein
MRRPVYIQAFRLWGLFYGLVAVAISHTIRSCSHLFYLMQASGLTYLRHGFCHPGAITVFPACLHL